jgi:hypothetical protein
MWVKQMGGSNLDEGHSISVDGAGNVYTTGIFYSTADFDPGGGVFNLTSSVASDIFISKLDALGNFVWAGQMGGTDHDNGSAVVADRSGNLFLTGYFSFTADFDPGPGTFNLTAPGIVNIFVEKLSSEPTTIISENDNKKQLSICPNPSNGRINIVSEENINAIRITDLSGRTVYESASNQRAISVVINKEGIYFVKVVTAAGISENKIIIYR